MRSVERAAVFTHGKPERVAPALERLRAVAREAGVELVDEADESAHPDLAIVLGAPEPDQPVELPGAGVVVIHRPRRR